MGGTEEAHQVIHNNKLLNVDGNRAIVDLNHLSSNQLTEIFSAADIPLTICISARLSVS